MEIIQGGGYNIDICFVIDSTGSMWPIIDEVKAKVLSLGDEICDGLNNAHKNVNKLRVRVIDYADFGEEADDAIHQSPFFTLPEDEAAFKNVIDSIQIEKVVGSGIGKGGDTPENGLEALFIAMNSDWTTLSLSQKGRHIIVLLTDAPPLNLQERDGSIGYESDEYPADINEMESYWSEDDNAQGAKTLSISKRNKRLLLFAPEGIIDGHSWEEVAGWENVVYTPVTAANGLGELNLDAIVAEIVRSV